MVARRTGRWHTAGALLWCACRSCASVRARAGRGHAVCGALRCAVCGVCVPCPSNARPVGMSWDAADVGPADCREHYPV